MHHEDLTQASRRQAAWALALIAGLAAVLRVVGLDFGLPHVYNQDELSIMARALGFAKGDLNPHNFLYPTFYFYVLFGWLGAFFVAGRAIGAFPSLAAFQTQFFVDPSPIYLAGRALSVVCGVACVWLVFRMGRQLAGRTAGLAASLFLAVAPFAVQDAHYVKHDVPATLAVLIACAACLHLEADAPGRRRLLGILVAGAATGMAFSTHYYTVFLTLPLAAAVVVSSRDRRTAPLELGAAALAAAVVFFALSPFLLVEWRTALADLAANRSIVVDRAIAGREGPFASAGAYARMMSRDAMGWPVVLLALAGIPVLWRRARAQTVIVLLFPLGFLAFISNTVPATRYLNPALPFAAIFAGVAVAAVAGLAGRWRAPVALVLSLGAAAPGCWDSLNAGWFFRQDDTRTLALRFIEANVRPGSAIAVQPYSVPLTQSRESLLEALRVHLGDPDKASPKFALRLRLNPYPAPAYRTTFIGDGGLDVDKIYVGYGELGGPHGLTALRNRGVAWIVLKRYPRPAPETVAFLAALEAEGRLIASFSPYRQGITYRGDELPPPYLHNTDARITRVLERPGPVVEVWGLSDVQQ
jgi:hypothetical protein